MSAVAGVVGLVPQGLVLLVSAALAVAVVRLAREQVVIQELHAVEGLARIDVLCVDKTGTLTTGEMHLDRIELLGDPEGAADLEAEVRSALAALAANASAPTATLTAAAGDAEAPDWRCTADVPFNSARKWSGATFEPGGTWLVGAPEVLLGDGHPDVHDRLGALTEDARRVVLVARSGSTLDRDGGAPDDLEPVALVVLAEELRSDAADTMRYFAEQGVTVKIISGDNPATVSAVARRLGIDGADDLLDLRDVDLAGDAASVEEQVNATTVFGRVQPQQKRQLVEILQRQGHTVAMTGDGVNDIPALKQADVAIAQNTATAATKAVSQLVLLDGRFDRMPGVVAEGRRVITNMERVSALFVTKTVYAATFAIVIGIWGAAFPFLPRHLSLVSETTIGIPAFALSFRSADRPYRPGYLRRVLRFAVPAGLVTAATVLAGYGIVRGLTGASLDEARTASTLLLLAVALWILLVLMEPVDRTDGLILGSMTALAVLIVATPIGRRFYALDLLPLGDALLLAGYGLAVIAGLTAGPPHLARHRLTRLTWTFDDVSDTTRTSSDDVTASQTGVRVVSDTSRTVHVARWSVGLDLDRVEEHVDVVVLATDEPHDRGVIALVGPGHHAVDVVAVDGDVVVAVGDRRDDRHLDDRIGRMLGEHVDQLGHGQSLAMFELHGPSSMSVLDVGLVVEPRIGTLEQEQAHMFAPVECLRDGCIVVHVHVGQVERDAGDDREAALGGIGDARERVDRRHLDRQVEAADAGDLGGEHQQVGRVRERRQRPGEQQREA